MTPTKPTRAIVARVPAMNIDHAAWLLARDEDLARESAKVEAAARYDARVAAGTAHRVSDDPTTGLQPSVNSHDAWLAEGRVKRTRTPHCTGCGEALDPTFCDPDARARAAAYDAAQKQAVLDRETRCPACGHRGGGHADDCWG